ncbi:MAG: FliH/SctL family protein [Pseudomonadota bacterium]
MAEAARYLFDRTFDAPTRRTESEEAVAAQKMQEEWERKMAEACCAAYEEGRSEGEAEARKSLEAETNTLIGQILQRLEKIQKGADKELDRIRADAIQLGSLMANVLAEELIVRSPALNLESVFIEALEHMGDAPHIAVTVNDALVEEIQKLVSAVATERGFKGNIVVLGDPDTTRGDCNLQWADGGITLDLEKRRTAVAQIVDRHLDGFSASSPAKQDAVKAPVAEPAAELGDTLSIQEAPGEAHSELNQAAMSDSGEIK